MTNGFYVNPNNSTAVWASANPSDGQKPAIESAIATNRTRSGSPAGRAPSAPRPAQQRHHPVHQPVPQHLGLSGRGQPRMDTAATMAADLNSAGLSSAYGFSLNVSSFYTVAQNVDYANQVNADLNSDYGFGYGYGY